MDHWELIMLSMGTDVGPFEGYGNLVGSFEHVSTTLGHKRYGGKDVTLLETLNLYKNITIF